MKAKKRKVLITAGLPYSNGRLHVGHIAGCYLPADIIARYRKLCGDDVRYVCGSDDHGVAIMVTAAKENKTPSQIADYFHDLQKKDFEGLDIQMDIYGSTSRNPYHQKMSQDFFKSMFDKGYFSKEKTEQFFDTKEEIFLPDRYVQGECSFCGAKNQNGDQCENCGKLLDVHTLRHPTSTKSGNPASVKETFNWFLDLGRFEKEVRQWLENAQIREQTRNFVYGLIADGLVKRSMTRDISWGVPVPLEDADAKNKVLYVWFDAPIGYISNTMEMCNQEEGKPDSYEAWWKNSETEILHFIGEDNTIFHCVIWIAMLAAEGSHRLPNGVIVNQFLNIQFPKQEIEKISKSRGTAVWIGDYLEEGNHPDSLRYYLTWISPERARTVYKPEDLIQRHNSELVNTLGNFVNRTLTFTRKHIGEKVPSIHNPTLDEMDEEFLQARKTCVERIQSSLEDFSTQQGLQHLMDFVRKCNKYIDERAPWVTRKTNLERTEATLNLAIQGMKTIGVCLLPFLPRTGERILSFLNIPTNQICWDDSLTDIAVGSKLLEPELLFAKIDSMDVQSSS